MSGQWPDTNIQLADGRKARVDSMLWNRTYAMLFEGRPNADTDQRVVKSALRQATANFSLGKVVLHQASAFHAAHSRLPNVTLTAELTSDSIDPIHDFSALTVVCFFEHDPQKPIFDLLENAIRDIDWAANAADCDF